MRPIFLVMQHIVLWEALEMGRAWMSHNCLDKMDVVGGQCTLPRQEAN